MAGVGFQMHFHIMHKRTFFEQAQGKIASALGFFGPP
jgi:hypothetical protein